MKIVNMKISVVVDTEDDADLEAEARFHEIPGVIYAKTVGIEDTGSEWTPLPAHGEWIHLAK